MNIKKNFAITFALGAMVALAAILTAPAARAQSGGDSRPAVNVLPPVGIAFGQTFRVTFLYVSTVSAADGFLVRTICDNGWINFR